MWPCCLRTRSGSVRARTGNNGWCSSISSSGHRTSAPIPSASPSANTGCTKRSARRKALRDFSARWLRPRAWRSCAGSGSCRPSERESGRDRACAGGCRHDRRPRGVAVQARGRGQGFGNDHSRSRRDSRPHGQHAVRRAGAVLLSQDEMTRGIEQEPESRRTA